MAMRKCLTSLLLCVLVLTVAFRLVRGGQTKPSPPFSRGPFKESTPELLEGPILAADHSLASKTTHDEWPALAAGPDHRVAVAWIAFDNTADWLRVATARVGEDGTPADVKVDTIAGPGALVMPAAVYDSSGALWVVWCSREGNEFDLFAKRHADGAWGKAIRLTTEPGPDARPCLAVDGAGNVRIAWQGFRNGSLDILSARLTAEGLVDVQPVTSSPASDWSPAMAIGPDGAVYVAWDTYRNRSYDVYARTLRNGTWGEEIPVAATPRREAHPSLAVDADGVLWIGYDVGEEDWGRHVRLHSIRRIELRCLRDGQVGEAAQPVVLPFREEKQPKQEWPHLVFDEAGRLWVGFMRFASLKPKPRAPAKGKAKGKRRRRRRRKTRGMIFLYATHFDGKAWAPPVALGASSGRGHDRLRMATLSSGLPFAAWASDDRKLPYNEVGILGDVHWALLDKSLPAETARMAPARLGPPKVEPGTDDPILKRKHLPEVTLGEKTYRLAFGDTHRHTDLSRCNYRGDGTLTDAYRYAIDVGTLDFLAVSDHDQDLNGWRMAKPCPVFPRALWWRSEKYADLHTLPGRFQALYGYERGRTTVDGGGHKNVVYSRRGQPVLSMNPQKEFFAALAGADAIVIPHQLADGPDATDWEKWNEQFERVAEIYQTRGSYEREDARRHAKRWTKGHSMNDAFQKGARIGIIASSDHNSTHNAFAGVYLDEFTKKGILAGMRARRTFGATEVIELQATLNGRPMGSELTVKDRPRIVAAVRAYQPLEQIDVIRDNRVIYSRPAEGERAELSFTDADLAPGRTAYYYVRVYMTDEAQAWTSPFWVTWPE